MRERVSKYRLGAFLFFALVGLILGAMSFFLPSGLFKIMLLVVLSCIILVHLMQKGIFYLITLAIFFSMTLPKAGFEFNDIPFTIGNVLLAASFVLWVIKLTKEHVMTGLIRLKKTVIDKPFMLYVVMALISVFISLYFNANPYNIIFEAIIFLGYAFVFYLIVNNIKDEKQIRLVFLLLTASAFLVSIYGIMQYFIDPKKISIPFLTYPADHPSLYLFLDRNRRIFSTFVNPNLLGNYLVMFMFIPLGIFLNEKRDSRYIYLILFAITMYCLFLTGSRGALIGFIAGMFVLFLTDGFNIKRVFKYLFVVLVLVSLALIISPRIIEFNTITFSDFSMGVRVQNYKRIFETIEEYPFGMGLGTSSGIDYLSEIQIIEVGPGMIWQTGVHSLYGSIIIKMGIFGLLFFLWIMRKVYSSFFAGLEP